MKQRDVILGLISVLVVYIVIFVKNWSDLTEISKGWFLLLLLILGRLWGTYRSAAESIDSMSDIAVVRRELNRVMNASFFAIGCALLAGAWSLTHP